MSDYFCGVHEHRHGRVGDAAECALKQKDAELTELCAVLAAAGIAKVDGVWVKPCEGEDIYFQCRGGRQTRDPDYPELTGEPCRICDGTGRIPIPNLAPVAGGDK